MSKEAMKLALEALETVNRTDLSQVNSAITALRQAFEQPAPVAKPHEQEPAWRTAGGIPRFKPAPVQQEPEFFTHSVDQPYDWSEWVCPDPKGYLMKCCDCGLVHEAEFGVVRYKSETEREDCDMVDDPNLQAVFRMRRSEQWSPEDTAHRAGGLTMEQPTQQEPYCWMSPEGTIYQASDEDVLKGSIPMYLGATPAQQEPVAVVDDTGVIVVCSYKYKPGDKLYTSPPAQRKPLTGLLSIARKHTEGRMVSISFRTVEDAEAFERYAIEAAHGIKRDA
jgi:hypothetical protein